MARKLERGQRSWPSLPVDESSELVSKSGENKMKEIPCLHVCECMCVCMNVCVCVSRIFFYKNKNSKQKRQNQHNLAQVAPNLGDSGHRKLVSTREVKQFLRGSRAGFSKQPNQCINNAHHPLCSKTWSHRHGLKWMRCKDEGDLA